MSSVIRPAGPLPSRVYWVRRLLLLAILVLFLSVAWLMVGRVLGSADAPAATGSTSGGGTPAVEPGHSGGGGSNGSGGSSPGGNGPGQHEAGGHGHHGASAPGHRHQGDRHDQGKRVFAQPTGDCAPTDVGMSVSVDDAGPGQPTPVTLTFTSLASPACTLAITPDSLMLRITSGEDVVWSSDDCPDDLLAKELVVRSHPATDYTLVWNGFRSTPSCAAPGKITKPGGYWAEAALIGADAHRGYFDIK
jgi:hypothetical protein